MKGEGAVKAAKETEEFENIYRTYYRDVFAFMYRTCGQDHDLAEELTQETFFEAFRCFYRYNATCTIYTWLCAIGKNIWFHYLRKHKNTALDLEAFGETLCDDEDCSPEAYAERSEKGERQEYYERRRQDSTGMNNGGNGYNNRRNTYSQRSESNQRGESNYQRSENYQRGENNYQRSENYQRAENYQHGGNGQSEEEMEIPGYGQLDSGMMANGILEVIPEGFGFIRCENYMPGTNDVYVSPAQIRRFNLRTGDVVCGNIKVKTEKEKFSALLYIRSVNGMPPYEAQKRGKFEDMTPIFPDHRINLETPNAPVSMRIMNLVSPIGLGQRGMIVSPPKTGKTTLLKQVAKAINTNYPDMQMIILLIDERPEEVTDIKEYIEGKNVDVIYSTFDETPEHHKRVSEMVLERAKRLVEHKKDVVILLDSITRLARAYNLTVPPSGRTLSGGLDPAALHMPKKFFGAARNMREGGSLTVLATALVETGS